MLYSGDIADVCAISFTPVRQIERPVGFDARHAFECQSIVEWLTKCRCINPVTSQVLGPVPISSVLHPLIIEQCTDSSELEQTLRILTTAGNAIDSESDAKVGKVTALFYHEFYKHDKQVSRQALDDIQDQRYYFFISPLLAINGFAWLCVVTFFSLITVH